MQSIASQIVLLVTLCFASSLHAQEREQVPDWEVTTKDFHGSSGVTLSHVITPQSITTTRHTDNEDDEPVEVNELDLTERQLQAIRSVLNRIPLDELEEEYNPKSPVFGGSVTFIFKLPNQDQQQIVVWQGARVRALKQVVDCINRFLPDEYRIRAMD